MYHSIVKGIATKNFEAVNNKDYDALLKGCAPNIRHRFGGHHALGGIRNDTTALRQWFERLGVVYPDLKLTPVDVWVKGWPWDTTIIIRWTATATFADGSPYANHGVHIINLKWGKAHSIDANEDSQIVARYLDMKAATGCKEAAMPMIES